MKKSKISTKSRLIIAMVAMVMSFTLASSTTYAWFAMNRTVTASGMKLQAQAEGSIVITNTTGFPVEGTVATNLAINDANATMLFSSTHDANATTYPTLLKRVTNGELINPETGVALNSTATLTYADAENVEGKLYFRDYTIFIAGDGQTFSNQDLIVRLTGTQESTSKVINNAISIDFYGQSVSTTLAVAAVSSANYKGTLNVANVVNNTTNNGNVAKVSFEIEDITIPKTGTTAAYAITMRVYYDGALIQTGGTYAYTTYEAATGTDNKCVAGKYYYNANDGTSIATVTAGTTPITGLFQVNTAASSYAYARTTSVADLAQVVLQASFTAKNHD